MVAKGPESELEFTFQTLRVQLCPSLPEPEWDHVFHPTRKWRFDAAWVKARLAVEVEGGIWGRPVNCHACGARVMAKGKGGRMYPVTTAGGRHVRGAGYTGDVEKYNEASRLGWIVLRVTKQMMTRDPIKFFRLLEDAYYARVSSGPSGIQPTTPSERGAVAGWMLASGIAVTTRGLAERLGITNRGARGLLQRASRVLPIYRPEAGVWQSVLGRGNGSLDD
jgi:hypothetical protein